jgi:hypothetical protein
MKSERRTQQKLYWSGALLMCGIIFAAAYSARKADALAGIPDPASRVPAGASRISTAFGNLPLCFIENQGQVDARVAYYVQGRDRSAFFSSRGITFTLTSPPEPAAPETAGDNETAEESQEHLTALSRKHLAGAFLLPGGSRRPESRRRHTLNLDFVGASLNVRPVGQDLMPTVVSYFNGPREQWKTELKTYGGILYPNLWPGIDLVYTGTDDRLKYTFLVRPGADPEQIRLAWRGATGVQVSEAGELEVSTPAGVFRDEKPYVYQEVEGKRVEVDASWDLKGTGVSTARRSPQGAYEYGFRLGKYDRSQPLVLDPAFLLYAGFIGGGGDDRGLGIAVDGAGNAYATGQIPSLLNGVEDVFVAKVNATGTALIYLAFIGGTNFDAGFDITVDPGGNAYVAGATASDEASFPATVGPDLTFNGSFDAFVAKLNAVGTTLVYCGYIGGSDVDFAEGIVLDSFGNAYVEGPAASTQATFPVTVGPDLTHNGRFDLFVAKVKAVPNNPQVTNNFDYCGYIGGSNEDVGVIPIGGGSVFVTSGHIAVDAQGRACVSGMTRSTEATFPDGDGFGSLPGPDRTYNGRYDAYVARLKADGTGLVYASYLGGSGNDFGQGMGIDSTGNVYLTGWTDSSEATFPVSVGPDLTFNGGLDAFVAKLNAAGTGLVYCGYIGGSSFEQGFALTVDGSGNVYVAGRTFSSEATFPVTAGPDLTFNGNADAFVVKVKAIPNNPVVTGNFHFSGYIGGTGEDTAFWIVLDTAGNAYVVGETNSTEATFPDGDGFGSVPGPDQTINGGFDAFVAKIGS